MLIPAAGVIALRDLPDRRARARFAVVTGLLSAGHIALTNGPVWTGPQVLRVARREHLVTTPLPALAYFLLEPVWGGERAFKIVNKVALFLAVSFGLFMAVRP